MQNLNLVVPTEAQEQRIDRWLTEQLTDHSRNEIQRWIEEKRVTVDQAEVKAGYRLSTGETIEIDIPDAPKAATIEAQNIPLTILYEDNDILVIDKPAGLVVHPAPGHQDNTVVNAVLHHLPDLEGVGGEQRPGVVHRLDKDTSGVLVIAKNDRAHRNLQEQFKDRTVYKEYLALVDGRVNPAQGRIVTPMGRHPKDRKRFAVLPETQENNQSKEAITEYETLSIYQSKVRGLAHTHPFTLLRVLLHTGRTHQIRVHLSWFKHPVIGDTVYGPDRPRLPIHRQFLHAHKLRLKLPSTNEEMEFVAPLPTELEKLLNTMEMQ